MAELGGSLTIWELLPQSRLALIALEQSMARFLSDLTAQSALLDSMGPVQEDLPASSENARGDF